MSFLKRFFFNKCNKKINNNDSDLDLIIFELNKPYVDKLELEKNKTDIELLSEVKQKNIDFLLSRNLDINSYLNDYRDNLYSDSDYFPSITDINLFLRYCIDNIILEEECTAFEEQIYILERRGC